MSAFRWKVWLLMIFCNVRGQAFQAPKIAAPPRYWSTFAPSAPGIVPVGRALKNVSEPEPEPIALPAVPSAPAIKPTRLPVAPPPVELTRPWPAPSAPAIVPTVGPNTVEKFRTSHPYTVSLRRRLDMGYFCAGVVIGKRHVLTAAHCLDSSRTSADSRPLVVVGSASSSKTMGQGVQVISTQNVFIHPKFRSSRRPDLAILELERDAFQTPVRIPSSFRPQAGNSLLVFGWGRQSPFSQFSEVIQVTSMLYVPRKTCALRRGSKIRRHQICLGGREIGSCEGDNGGPIVLPGRTRDQDILVGIIGDSHACRRSRKPGVHTNITPFLNWIKSTAGIP